MLWILLAATFVLVAFCLLGLSIRVLLKKDGQFSHRCASREEGGDCCCQVQGKHEDCPNYQLHHGNTATRMAKAAEMASEG